MERLKYNKGEVSGICDMNCYECTRNKCTVDRINRDNEKLEEKIKERREKAREYRKKHKENKDN